MWNRWKNLIFRPQSSGGGKNLFLVSIRAPCRSHISAFHWIWRRVQSRLLDGLGSADGVEDGDWVLIFEFMTLGYESKLSSGRCLCFKWKFLLCCSLQGSLQCSRLIKLEGQLYLKSLQNLSAQMVSKVVSRDSPQSRFLRFETLKLYKNCCNSFALTWKFSSIFCEQPLNLIKNFLKTLRIL